MIHFIHALSFYLEYVLHVKQVQSESIGDSSVAKIFFFKLNCPSSTRAQPNLSIQDKKWFCFNLISF